MKHKLLPTIALSVLLLVTDACGGGMEQARPTPTTPAMDPAPVLEAAPAVAPAVTPTAPLAPTTPAAPPAPTTPGGEAVKLEPVTGGFRLTFPPGVAFEWEGERTQRQYQFYFIDGHPGRWVVDLDKQAITRVHSSLQSYFGLGAPFQLPDGRWLSVTGNIQNWTHLAFVIENRATGVSETVGERDGRGVIQIAPAGEHVVAFAEFSPDPDLFLGALWQYDWQSRQYAQVAEPGMAVGMLADGRMVGQRGERFGEVFSWRTADPSETEAISLPGIDPYLATVLPGGRYLAYFISAEVKTSWWGPKVAHASPQRSALPPRPPVKALAVYDAATGKTRVTDLPATGKVGVTAKDPAGNPIFSVDYGDTNHTVFLRVDGEGNLSELYRSGEKEHLYGWDRCAMLVSRQEAIYRVKTAGCPVEPAETMLAHSDRALVGNGLIAFPAADYQAKGGMEFLDVETGKWYLAHGMRLPATVSPTLRFETFRPESGYVGIQEGQSVYQIIRVKPLAR